MPRPLLESDIIFPSAASNVNTTLTELKRSNLSITNRLHSIKQDAGFVLNVADTYGLPLIANERCGSWYIPPGRKSGSAYFKSTDGHFGQWAFSLRRLNLQVLQMVNREGGCIIVDSTRRGKSMPDALSKTVPIWIAVFNRLLFPELPESHALHTPPDVVSSSEHSQIEARLPDLVGCLRDLHLDEAKLRSTLIKPMRSSWLTPGADHHLAAASTNDQYMTVVLVTASNRMSEGSHNVANYVQGAADDSESWALNLDPASFWANNGLLLAASEDELPLLIQSLVAKAQFVTELRQPTLIVPSRQIWIATNATAEQMHGGFDVVICCNASESSCLVKALKGRYIRLACGTGKNGSRQLRAELPKLEMLATLLSADSSILVACETGKDLAVGVALAILCSYFGSDGSLRLHTNGAVAEPINKSLIKQRLSWIMASMPDASPSRATLQSVNAYLMG
ncbi:tRNA A64-2'-O-ribosylphosphate transferase [Teratosphaeriaceae sp. CCFEE 6253]|nr:tRNA A64-2'-O-ribosylphosphate transferase [Teratosphaeriaceae sp. CCFEE 6253]